VPLDQAVPIALEKRVEELTTAGVGQLAIVRGTVTAADPFSSGVKLTLDDATGAVVVLLWQSVYDALSDPAALDVGAQIQVQGEISEYRGTLELIPELATDVRVLAAAPPPAETEVSALTAADVGRVVTLRGTLGPPEPFSAGVKFPLDDGTGQIVLLLWSNVCEHAPQELGADARVIVTGEVGEYRGALELIPRHAGEIRVTGQGQPPTPAPTVWPPIEVEARAVGDVTSADVGAVLLLTGTLGEPQPFSQGIKFPLDDATGTIILLLWQEVYDAIPDADRLVVGARVEVVGRIDEYRGDLEIIPEPDGVQVIDD
jgi:DNA/RNA endonuclease YhcR with UshA esterase domain